MSKKERKQEEELINQIRHFRQLFRDSVLETLSKDREKRHKKGEVFYEGFWVPREKISGLQKFFLKRGRIVFFEIHLLVIILLLFCFIFWIFFKRFLLPWNHFSNIALGHWFFCPYICHGIKPKWYTALWCKVSPFSIRRL